MKLLFLLMFLATAAFGEEFYYSKDDGEKTIYKMECEDEKCSLSSLMLADKKSMSSSCTLIYKQIFKDQKLVSSDKQNVISATEGACQYTISYKFNADQITQTKTSPLQTDPLVEKWCEKVKDKVLLTATKAEKELDFSVAGCKKIRVKY